MERYTDEFAGNSERVQRTSSMYSNIGETEANFERDFRNKMCKCISVFMPKRLKLQSSNNYVHFRFKMFVTTLIFILECARNTVLSVELDIQAYVHALDKYLLPASGL